MDYLTGRLAFSWTAIARPLAPSWRTRLSLFQSERWECLEGESTSIIVETSGQRPETFVFAVIRQLEEDNSLRDSLGCILADELFKIPCVKAVYFDFDEEQTTIGVWTILRDVTELNRKAVYAAELGLIDKLPSVVFNFRTASEEGENVPESGGYRQLTR